MCVCLCASDLLSLNPTQITSKCLIVFYSILFFFTGLRGTGADIVEIEEAAHCDPQLFSKIVSALISMQHVPCLAISTPDDENK
jgi:hypothetical protein